MIILIVINNQGDDSHTIYPNIISRLQITLKITLMIIMIIVIIIGMIIIIMNSLIILLNITLIIMIIVVIIVTIVMMINMITLIMIPQAADHVEDHPDVDDHDHNFHDRPDDQYI